MSQTNLPSHRYKISIGSIDGEEEFILYTPDPKCVREWLTKYDHEGANVTLEIVGKTEGGCNKFENEDAYKFINEILEYGNNS